MTHRLIQLFWGLALYGLSIGLILIGILSAKLVLMLYSSLRAVFFELEQRRLSRSPWDATC